MRLRHQHDEYDKGLLRMLLILIIFLSVVLVVEAIW